MSLRKRSVSVNEYILSGRESEDDRHKIHNLSDHAVDVISFYTGGEAVIANLFRFPTALL